MIRPDEPPPSVDVPVDALEIDGRDEAERLFFPCVSKDVSAVFLRELAVTDKQACM